MALTASKDLTDQTVSLISRFQSGQLKPIPTGISHLDDMLLGGLLPGTVVGIVARSSHGKSYDAERIQRNVMKFCGDEVIYVNANWEMGFFKILVRDICQRTGKSMAEVLFEAPDTEALIELKEICNSHRTENVLYQNEPVSPDVFAEDIEGVIAAHPNKKIVVSIDNLENILITKGDQKSSMDALLYQVNRLKNLHPFISFIILNQMNTNYILRMDDPKKQKPMESDIYGSDQLLKLCDVLYIKMLPFRIGIRDKFMVFGKESYSWLEEFKVPGTNENLAHFDPVGCAYYFYLKRRNADPKDMKDIFAERLFKREEMEIQPPTEGSTKPASSPPIFAPPTFDATMTTVMFNTSAMTSAQGAGFEDIPTIEEDEEAPF